MDRSELIVKTQYDGKDLMAVSEVMYLDDDGEEVRLGTATGACMGAVTCADQGTDLWEGLRQQVEARLKAAGIAYKTLTFEGDC